MERFALDDLEEVKTAGHGAELHLVVHRLAGIVLMEVSVQRRAVAAVEGFEPSLVRSCLCLRIGLLGRCGRQC